MRAIPKDTREGERPHPSEASALQALDEFHDEDLAELTKIAKSIVVELETPGKAPLAR